MPDNQPPIRALPVRVRPLTDEVLASYITRLAERNMQTYYQLQQQLKAAPSLIHALALYSGRPPHHLTRALPELRTPTTPTHKRTRYHHDKPPPSPACSHCAAKIGVHTRVNVHAPRSRVLCHRHHRWIGGTYLRCDLTQQFSIQQCPELDLAARRHHRALRRHGAPRAESAFYDATRAFAYWAQHGVLRNNALTDIHHRRHAFGATDIHPSDPRIHAACYPNTVKLTEIILNARRQLRLDDPQARPRIITATLNAVAAHVLSGIQPTGVGDPVHQALYRDHYDPLNPYSSWGASTPAPEDWMS